MLKYVITKKWYHICVLNITYYDIMLKYVYYNKKWYHICVLNITYYDIMLKYDITTKSDIIYVSSI